MSKNLLTFVAGGSKGGEFNDYYRPDNFGEFTKDNTGVRTNLKTKLKTYTFEKDTYFKQGANSINASRSRNQSLTAGGSLQESLK